MVTSSILDPVASELPPAIWLDAASPTPTMRPILRQWLMDTVYDELERFQPDARQWASLVLTGSLTTYQYGPYSDLDVSVFVNPNFLPEWDRSKLITYVVHNLDGKKVAGTSYPLQVFVVSPKVSRELLYQPGLRSGYDLNTDQWIVPPEPGRSHDVEKEYNAWYVFALEVADKLKSLLKFNPKQALGYWYYLHKKRREEEARGHGDYGLFNIAYKMLDRSGMIRELQGLESKIAGADKDGNYDKFTTSDEEHEKGKLKWGPPKPHFLPGVKKSAANPEWLQRWIAQNGPYMVHRTNDAYRDPLDTRSTRDKILREGLIPHDRTDPQGNPIGSEYTDMPALMPRSNHSYIRRQLTGGLSGMNPQNHLYVDLRKLDPSRINADEDAFESQEGNVLWGLPPRQQLDYKNGRWESRGTWADRVGLNDPAHVAHSANRIGTLAVEGGISPEALVHPDIAQEDIRQNYPQSETETQPVWYGGITPSQFQRGQQTMAHKQAALADQIPAAPGTTPIPEGTMRLWHYTAPQNIPAIQQQGLLYNKGRGDSGTGEDEPSKGVWASTRQPNYDDFMQRPYIEYYAYPQQLSRNAEHYWDRDPIEWANSGYHHVIMQGDVPPEQIVASHEPWHQHYNYIMNELPTQEIAQQKGFGPDSLDWALDDPAMGPAVQAWKEQVGLS